MTNGELSFAGRKERTMSKLLTTTNDETEVGPLRCHPGEVLKEEFMIPLGLSANKLAIALRVPSGRIVDIINEKRSVTADTAMRLSRYFGTSARLWLNLQADFDLALAEDKIGDTITREIIPMNTRAAA
jgi:antitoxin HigA-1